MIAAAFLAYANGANDNFKGVATLFGSRTAGYRKALLWATVTTFAGSLAALQVSQGLVQAFSGNGLVPVGVMGWGAALTVFLATVAGFPVSTTHALIGALIGAGWVAAGPGLPLDKLGQGFLLPLAVSPFLSFGLTGFLYPLFRRARQALGIQKQLCLCIGPAREPVALQPNGAVILSSTGVPLTIGERSRCVEQYRGVLLGIDAQQALDFLHYLSAGWVGFARGLNDTPKIVALLLAAQTLQIDARIAFVLVGVGMALGGMFSAWRVARTMSEQITPMNHGQGFTANAVTALLVTLASGAGLPVSTTHVSCGSLFGIGAVTGRARWPVIRNIVFSWVVTLPMAAFLSALFFLLSGCGMLPVESAKIPAAVPDSAGSEIQTGYREVVGVLHVHSTYSDGSGSVEKIARIAQEQGLDFVGITDHNTLQGRREGKQKQYGKTLVLVDDEISTKGGHYLALNVPEEPESYQKPEKTV